MEMPWRSEIFAFDPFPGNEPITVETITKEPRTVTMRGSLCLLSNYNDQGQLLL